IYNTRVQGGLSYDGMRYAFGDFHISNWHPLALLSHMLDCDLFQLWPGGHHLTSVLFHAANTVLLFCLLRRMTGGIWRSAMVAALFAWHPLHVQSVAWVSERKDVLSTFFFMLTLWAYVRYAENAKRKGEHSTFNYWLTLIFFALGLMAKPMLVTLPCVLLL